MLYINNKPCANLAKWCREHQENYSTFGNAISRAKAKGVQAIECKGYNLRWSVPVREDEQANKTYRGE